MAQRARWMRLGPVGGPELRAACAGLAAAQAPDAPPIVLWARAKAQICLGGGLEPFRAEERQPLFAVIAPRRLAPGRSARWIAWAISPAIAAYRGLGWQAYLEGGEILLHGRAIGASGAAAIGACAVIVSGFLFKFPGERFARVLETTLRERFSAQHGWEFESAWPSAPEREAIGAAEREPAEASYAW